MVKSALILTAAGAGLRFAGHQDGFGTTKALFQIGGRAVFVHALEVLLHIPGLSRVIITVPKNAQEAFQESASALLAGSEVPVVFLPGGSTRQESVFLALKHLRDVSDIPEKVWIHDAARCCLSQNLVQVLSVACESSPAITLGIPCTDALKECDQSGQVIRSLDRRDIILVQTPQIFDFGLILQAHEEAASREKFDFADDAEMVENIIPVRVIHGSKENLKLTEPVDALFVEHILRAQGRAEVGK